jgi:hypothetical protein
MHRPSIVDLPSCSIERKLIPCTVAILRKKKDLGVGDQDVEASPSHLEVPLIPSPDENCRS